MHGPAKIELTNWEIAMSFICYKITHDSGFAPNPHFGVITLATCKPTIRRTKTEGDWIAGFSTKELVENTKSKTGRKIKPHGLIYLMKVAKTLTLEEYYNDPFFSEKKPVYNHKNDAIRAGDNIYAKKGDRYVQHKNNSHPYHDENNSIERPNIKHDIDGVNVLIADMTFSFYFGEECLMPNNGWNEIGFAMSTGRTFYREEEDLKKLLNFIEKSGFQPGFCGNPCLRPDIDDDSKVACGGSCSGA